MVKIALFCSDKAGKAAERGPFENLTRVPCVGEFVASTSKGGEEYYRVTKVLHILDPENTSDGTYAEVWAVEDNSPPR
jgi:hypothetical protein